MDYRGQQLSERIHYILVILFGAIAWFAGFYYTDFQQTFYGWLVGLVLSLLLCIPDWPWYNRNKVQWLEEIPDHTAAIKAMKAKTK